MNKYTSGTLVRTIAANFTDINGVVKDPTTTTLKYRKGLGAVTTAIFPAAPIVKDSAGNFHADLDTSGFTGPDLELWEVEWIGTGDVVAIGTDEWQVEPRLLP